jgi:lipoate-protein ligase A
VYGGQKHTHLVEENHELKNNEFVIKSYQELQSWEWQWGQTPEFTIQVEGPLSWASLVRNIHSIFQEERLLPL